MKTKTILILLLTHLMIGGFGFAAGIYALPILTAPKAPTQVEIDNMANEVLYHSEFRHDLKDSDLLHRGKGIIELSDTLITFVGSISPGPDYKLYLSPQFIETEAEFIRMKSTMQQVGDVKTFNNFVVPVAQGIDVSAFNTVIVWCESFNEFITAAKYQ